MLFFCLINEMYSSCYFTLLSRSSLDKIESMIRDTYGEYTPSPPPAPVPAFPCTENPACTAVNRLCQNHKRVLFVSVADPNTSADWRSGAWNGAQFEIPYGNWENFDWYAERISEVSGLPTDSFRIIFAGCQRFPDGSLKRHSGLQCQSRILVIKRKLVESSSEN